MTLRDLRIALGYTQREVADEIGIAQQAYQRYERGTVIPNAVLAVKIAKALKTTVEEIYGGEV